MGKKTRKEREEKRDTYANQRGKAKRKTTLIAIGVFAGIAAIVGISGYNFVTMQGDVLGAPPGAGTLGDEHEHASILVRIHGDKFDFSASTYQIKNSWIHFEDQDGTTIHRHSSGVTTGYLFETLGITLDENCYIFPDGREFCTNDDFSLKYFVNYEEMPSINDYVLEDDDRILITYGDESPEEIQRYLVELDSQPILA